MFKAELDARVIELEKENVKLRAELAQARTALNKANFAGQHAQQFNLRMGTRQHAVKSLARKYPNRTSFTSVEVDHEVSLLA